jgi:uncharacterized protein (TIGR03435 family)
MTAVAMCAVLLGAGSARAQSATSLEKPLQWDVISVKPMSPDSCPAHQGGVGWLKDGLTASCVPAVFLVQCAYGLMDQTRIAGLPDWTKDTSHLYAIEARVGGEDAAAYSKLSQDEQFRMLQQVLAERFQMKAHMEPREMPAYDLVVAKGGAKLKGPGPNESGATQWGASDGDVHWTGAPLTNLVWVLSNETGRPVVDKTGLTGRYSFTLEFAPSARAATDESGRPSVFTALEEQIGLKLVPSKEPVDVLVIDSIEPPAAN